MKNVIFHPLAEQELQQIATSLLRLRQGEVQIIVGAQHVVPLPVYFIYLQYAVIDAVAYYEEQKPGLGLEYLGEIEHAVNFLIRYPEAGSKVRDSLGRLILPSFHIFCYIVF